MYNYIGFWVRIIWLFLLCIAGIVIVFLGCKKLKMIVRIIISIFLSVSFSIGIGTTISALINPQIKTIVVTFKGELGQRGLGPFETEYCFENGEDTFYFDMDAFSKRQIYSKELIVGRTYSVSYEMKQNLIVQIVEN